MDPIVRSYFVAERDLGIFLAVAGIGALGFAALLLRSQSGAFLWGLVIPLVVIGSGAALGGGVLTARSSRQAAELGALAVNDPGALAAAELPRMARVNANWPRVKALWGVASVLSLAAIFFVPKDGVKGTALVLLATAGVLMTIDSLAERRALVYTDHVRSLER